MTPYATMYIFLLHMGGSLKNSHASPAKVSVRANLVSIPSPNLAGLAWLFSNDPSMHNEWYRESYIHIVDPPTLM